MRIGRPLEEMHCECARRDAGLWRMHGDGNGAAPHSDFFRLIFSAAGGYHAPTLRPLQVFTQKKTSPMQTIRQDIQVAFRYDVHFVADAFRPENDLLARIVEAEEGPRPRKILPVIDAGLPPHYPDLSRRMEAYFAQRSDSMTLYPPVAAPAGEAAKNDPALVNGLHAAIRQAGLCRHSFVLAIGGGSVLDLAGYAAATAHRGVRLIRMPTTVLAQNDAGVGVKNSVNALRAKNFLGAFAPPYAVVNDFSFLPSLSDRDWRSGMAEAVKVALIKDASFFGELEENAERLAPPRRDARAMERLIYRCAALHLDHIATSGDPFEMGASRPLDFGHWAAHQLEQLTDYALRHGEAVAAGVALDATYSRLSGLLPERDWSRVLALLETMGFRLYAPEIGAHMDDPEHPRSIFRGLEAFREHLGGALTIMLLAGVGRGVEVHEVDTALYREAIALLRERETRAEPIVANIS